MLVASPHDFVQAVVTLTEDPALRQKYGEAARAAGAQLDWDVLARRFEDEVLDRFLPPTGP